MIIKNWKDNPPSIVHKSGIDWRILSNKNQIDDIQKDTDANCLKMQSLFRLHGFSLRNHMNRISTPGKRFITLLKVKGKLE